MQSNPGADAPLKGEFDTIDQLLAAAAVQFERRDAYVEGEKRLTFGEWHRSARGLAGRLQAMGAGPGDVIGIHVSASIDYAICCAAAFLLGGVATGINTRLGPREMKAIIERANPRVVITEEPARFAEERQCAILPREQLSRLYAGPSLDADGAGRKADDPAVIVWTSGTTGTPKGVWYDHRILKAALRVSGVMSAPFDRRLRVMPFAHAGYMSKLWDDIAQGITTVIMPLPWNAPKMLELMVEERVTMASGVPTQWAKLLQLPQLAGADLSHLRVCVTASAPASPELVEEMTLRLGCAVVGRYAASECPSISGTLPDDDPEVICRTVGRPATDTRIVITDPAGTALPAGNVGRVRVKGPCVMRGYWNQDELTRESITEDGWLITGDLGSFDPAGNLVLAGRASDMYIRGGYNVYPLEIENVLHEHPDVSQAAVIGLATPVIGEIGVAFIVPATGAPPLSLEAVRLWCKERLADYKAPDRLEIIDALPLTNVMKIDKTALRSRLSAAADQRPANHRPPG
jgi:acyl-CoA synthetase (AMP-forming)/AMP-acid ligase II